VSTAAAPYDVFQRQRQSAEAKKLFWARQRWNDRTDFSKRLAQLTKKGLAELSRVAVKAAIAIVQLQDHRFGAVIADGAKIAARAGIAESTWWWIARPELERVGFFCTVERGGGRLPGGDGHANVYMVPGAGVEPVPPHSPRDSRAELHNDQAAEQRSATPAQSGHDPP
jgi:hypothetical protein